MDRTNDNVRVRFAPSPTGYLHIGGLRAAFFNWLFARHYAGKYLLRIEDTDIERSKPEYTQDILDSFKWTSIISDEPVVIQSEFFELHKKIAYELLEQNKAYKCFCTSEELAQRFDSNSEIYFKYDGKCRKESALNSNDRPAGSATPFVIRFKVAEDIDRIVFQDLIRGEVAFERDQIDDFIILRSDGTPTYNFVVVIDDARMKISHVLRGEEHISNTPKQILIYKACQYELPEFGHLPLILNPDGSKLSKRSATYTTVKDYRKNGFLADALCNYLVRLGWSHGDQEVFTRKELIEYFSIEHVGKKGSIFDIKKLQWINGIYIRNTSAKDLVKFIICDVMHDFKDQVNQWTEEKLFGFIDLYKDRVKTLKELAQEIISIYVGPKEFEMADINEYLNQQTIDNIKQVIQLLSEQKEFDHLTLAIKIKDLCKKMGIKLPDIAKPIRLAVTGKTSSAGIFELISLLSPDDSSKRLVYFIKYIESRK